MIHSRSGETGNSTALIPVGLIATDVGDFVVLARRLEAEGGCGVGDECAVSELQIEFAEFLIARKRHQSPSKRADEGRRDMTGCCRSLVSAALAW